MGILELLEVLSNFHWRELQYNSWPELFDECNDGAMERKIIFVEIIYQTITKRSVFRYYENLVFQIDQAVEKCCIFTKSATERDKKKVFPTFWQYTRNF